MKIVLWSCFIVLLTIKAHINTANAETTTCLANFEDSIAKNSLKRYFGEGIAEIDENSLQSIQNLSIKLVTPSMVFHHPSSIIFKQSDLFNTIKVCTDFCNSRRSESYGYSHSSYSHEEQFRILACTYGYDCSIYGYWDRDHRYYNDVRDVCHSYSECTKKIILGVEILDMSFCQLRQISSAMFSPSFTVTCIETLDISGNELSSIESSEFLSFTSLTNFNASHNNLTEIDWEYKNIISSQIPIKLLHHINSEKYGLQNLKELDLAYNSLSKFAITDLSVLECLNVSHNFLSMNENFLQKLPKSLKTLILSYNHPLIFKPKLFEAFANLTHLELRGLNISDISVDSFYGLESLETLDLSFNSLSTLPRNLLVYLKDITIMLLSNNQFHSIDFSALHSLSLRSLDLSYNSISWIDTTQLKKYLPNVHTLCLNIDGNDFHCQYLRELLSSLKTLKINAPFGQMLNNQSVSAVHGIKCRPAECLSSLKNDRIKHELRNYFRKSVAIYEVRDWKEEQSVTIQNLRVKLALPILNQQDGSTLMTSLLKQSEVLDEIQLCEKCSAISPGVMFPQETIIEGWRLRGHQERIGDYFSYHDCQNCEEKVSLGVEYLDISSCNLHQILSTTFPSNFRVSCLVELDISSNEISSINNNEFIRFKSVATLNVARNNLTKIDFLINQQSRTINDTDNQPYGLQSLTKLDLAHNRINELNITVLSQLNYLDVSHNLLIIDQNFIQALPEYLQTLILSFNQQLVLEPKLFERLSKLEHLKLSGLSIPEISFNSFYGLSLLKDLDISFNNLTTLPYGVLTGLDNIIALNLSNNQFLTLDFRVFYTKFNSNTTSVDLSSNQITNLNVEQIARSLPNLKHLNIDGNNWDCSVLSELIPSLISHQVSIPSGKVHHSKNVHNVDGIECTLTELDNINSKNQHKIGVNSSLLPHMVFPIMTTEKLLTREDKTASTTPYIMPISPSLPAYSKKAIKTTESPLKVNKNEHVPSSQETTYKTSSDSTSSTTERELFTAFSTTVKSSKFNASLQEYLSPLQTHNDILSLKENFNNTQNNLTLIFERLNESTKIQENVSSSISQLLSLLNQIKNDFSSKLTNLENAVVHKEKGTFDINSNEIGYSKMINYQHQQLKTTKYQETKSSFGGTFFTIILAIIVVIGLSWLIFKFKRRLYQQNADFVVDNSEMVEREVHSV